MGQSVSNPFSIQIRRPAAFAASFQLNSASGGSNLPFTLGYAFRKGDVPGGASVSGSLPGLQVAPKNYWSDGSLKFATISGFANLAAGATQTVTLALGTPVGGAALSTANLATTGITASIAAGSFGSASWSGADWSTPFQTWVSGPQMSSWIYRKAIGSDAHLVGWLEVRLYAGGAVEVLPWIENGYLSVAAPTSKSATYAFTLGGSQRFSAAIDLPNHCRTVLLSGAAQSHWLGAAPSLSFNHDKAYLQASRLVPAYRANVAPAAAVWSKLAQSYTPLQQGNYSNGMGQGGYQPAIGLLPEWDVLYLASSDARAFAGVIVNAYGAGRYGIHYRDQNTQRPFRFSSYPNLVVDGGTATAIANTGASSKGTYTPAPSGTAPATWDSPHHPSVGFTAYLLTGRFYFMEEVLFSATVNYLKNTDTTRKFSAGVFQSTAGANTARGAAWAIRTLAQAACVTPDSDTALRNEFLASLAANVDFYHTQYVAQPNNPQGFVQSYSNYTPGTGFLSEATWMQDFFTAAIGYAIDLDLPLAGGNREKLAAFFQWKARSVIGRFGGTASSEYLYQDAAVYTIVVAPADAPDFAGGSGPWFANWGDLYRASQAMRVAQAETLPTSAGLRGGNFPDPTSYWGNLQPALAYAVQHNVPGAQAAYERMLGAANWSGFASGFNVAPVWGVMPHA
ncbi:hypothetical protein [Massilia sp. erpn]|uniref:hypothetical protein n=1 Tax=Massilia sp. erpn TaxID=2738142 RepID=UPI00210308A6|nr:hypothetical protein [Massilia sp. erpn]UTY56872.1 hypothetical protein HPQ68_06525 [Massilia sp. erpn]